MADEGLGGRVLGVDACKAGWIGVALGNGQVTAYTAARIDELVAAASVDGPVEVVAIDIPIGLPDTGTRQADDLARAAVGRRWPSVFKTPVREALQAPDHASAIAINHRLAGAGVSAQAFALRAKLLQVDAWVRHTELRVVEVHPEVSFAALAGMALSEPKTTWAGATHRRRLLAEAGIEIPGRARTRTAADPDDGASLLRMDGSPRMSAEWLIASPRPGSRCRRERTDAQAGVRACTRRRRIHH